MRKVKDLVINERTRAIGFVKNIIRRSSRQRYANSPLGIALICGDGAKAHPNRMLVLGAKFTIACKLVHMQARGSPSRGRGIEVNTCLFERLDVRGRVSNILFLRRVRRKVGKAKGRA